MLGHALAAMAHVAAREANRSLCAGPPVPSASASAFGRREERPHAPPPPPHSPPGRRSPLPRRVAVRGSRGKPPPPRAHWTASALVSQTKEFRTSVSSRGLADESGSRSEAASAAAVVWTSASSLSAALLPLGRGCHTAARCRCWHGRIVFQRHRGLCVGRRRLAIRAGRSKLSPPPPPPLLPPPVRVVDVAGRQALADKRPRRDRRSCPGVRCEHGQGNLHLSASQRHPMRAPRTSCS